MLVLHRCSLTTDCIGRRRDEVGLLDEKHDYLSTSNVADYNLQPSLKNHLQRLHTTLVELQVNFSKFKNYFIMQFYHR